MNLYQKYGIEPGQVYTSADGTGHTLTVTDVTTYADCDDVVVRDGGVERRIDAFKLAMVRYRLDKP